MVSFQFFFIFVPIKKSICYLTKSARFHKLSNCPLRHLSHFTPRVVVGVWPRFRPRTAVANDIFPGQIVFIQLCLFAGTAGARGANDHLVLTPVYPCPVHRPIPPPAPSTVVDPPVVLFKYADYTRPFSPILAQHRRCWFCILVDDCLDFGGENHNFLKVYRLIRFIYQENRFNFFEKTQQKIETRSSLLIQPNSPNVHAYSTQPIHQAGTSIHLY